MGIAVAELLTLPAAAHMWGEYKIQKKPHVIAAIIDENPGISRYFVSSDGPFTITADKLSGPVLTRVIQSGKIGDIVFGEKAQLPGPDLKCAETDTDKAVIYAADKPTIVSKGEVVSNAVLITLVYDKSAAPKFDFKAGHQQTPNAQACRPV